MAEYIEREALLERWKRRLKYMVADEDGEYPINFKIVVDALEREPAADVVEVVHARWETIPGTKSRKHCTNCDFSGPEYIKFYSHCPNCGARMDGDA